MSKQRKQRLSFTVEQRLDYAKLMVNEVYTQHHNRMKKTDGSIFRGRFKSILVDQDAYIMQLSRYIHRNPIDMKSPLVEKLSDYKWSSYRAYINKENTPDWLRRDFVYDVLGFSKKYKAFEKYVNQGVDDEMVSFYSGNNLPAVICDSIFKEWIFDKILSVAEPEQKSRIVAANVTIKLVVDVVAKYYDVTVAKVTDISKRPQKENEARKVAMYLSQELSNSFLNDIAPYFNLKNTGSVSHATHQM